MDREAWQARVHGVEESETTEQLTYTHISKQLCASKNFTHSVLTVTAPDKWTWGFSLRRDGVLVPLFH